MDGAVVTAAAEHNSLPAQSSIIEPLQPAYTCTPTVKSSHGILETGFDLSRGLGTGLQDLMESIQLGEMWHLLDAWFTIFRGCHPSPSKLTLVA